MNTLERRRLVKAQIIDVAVAKAAINQSRRERSDAAKRLRKAMAASHSAAKEAETISYPRHASG
jgi:ribosome recycling factor